MYFIEKLGVLLIKIGQKLKKPRIKIPKLISSDCYNNSNPQSINEKNININKTNEKSFLNLKDDEEIAAYISEFRDLKVAEVMIPRTNVIAVPCDIKINELKDKFISTTLTRIITYRESLDNIVGFIHVKDFLTYLDKTQTFNINKIIRKVIYLPRSTKCIDLLSKMRESRTHVAAILDEYGGVEGIVTIERLVEQVIGEISDEHDTDDKDSFIKKLDEYSYVIDARTLIQDIEKELGKLEFLSEEEGEYETFGGFVLSYLDRIPYKGESFIHPAGFNIEVLDASPRKVKMLKLSFTNEKNNLDKDE